MNRYYAANPSDGLTTYQEIVVERSPDNGAGAPTGVYATLATVAIDPANQYTLYEDNGGASTDWYRHTWQATGGTPASQPSLPIQAGDSWLRQQLRADIPDADIDATRWDRWIQQTLIDLFARGMWLPTRTTITVTATGGSNDEYFPVPSVMRDVHAVEIVSNDAQERHSGWVRDGSWEQVGREIRILGASLGKYVVHGRRRFATVGELTEDYLMLAYRMTRLKGLQYRYNQRANFYKWVNYDKTTDIDIPDLQRMIADAKVEIAEDIRALALPEPAVNASWAV